MEELIARITAGTAIDAATASRAVGLVLAFLKKQGPQLEVGEMIAALPGADELITETETTTSGGPMGISGGGGLAALAGQLGSAGLDMEQMQVIGKALFAYARAKVGNETVGRVVAGIPGIAPYV